MFIITRAPLSIPLFVKKEGDHSQLVSLCLNKNVSVMVMPAFKKNSITLKYSQVECVTNPDDIRHPFLRSIFKSTGVTGVELSVVSDVNSGYGLSSGPAFATAALLALDTYRGRIYGAYKTAKDAAALDDAYQQRLPFFYQNYLAATNGGLKSYERMEDGFVKVDPLVFRPDALNKLVDSLHLYIGEKRGSGQEWQHLLSKFHSAFSDEVGAGLSSDDFFTQAEAGNTDCLRTSWSSFWGVEHNLLLQSPLADLVNALKDDGIFKMLLLDTKGYCLACLGDFRGSSKYGLSELPFTLQQAGDRVISQE